MAGIMNCVHCNKNWTTALVCKHCVASAQQCLGHLQNQLIQTRIQPQSVHTRNLKKEKPECPDLVSNSGTHQSVRTSKHCRLWPLWLSHQSTWISTRDEKEHFSSQHWKSAHDNLHRTLAIWKTIFYRLLILQDKYIVYGTPDSMVNFSSGLWTNTLFSTDEIHFKKVRKK